MTASNDDSPRALVDAIAIIYTEDFQDCRVVEGVRYVNPFASSTPLSA
jgi:predicted nucleic acid-binding protein